MAVLRKAMDIQAAQAQQRVEMVAQSVPTPAARIGGNLSVRA